MGKIELNVIREVILKDYVNFISIIFISTYFQFPVDLLSLSSTASSDSINFIEAKQSVIFILIIILLMMLSIAIIYLTNNYIRITEKNGSFFLAAVNSLVLGTAFAISMVDAAWQHNPMNSIHDGFYDIDYSHLSIIFFSWFLVVGLLTAAAQATGLFIVFLLRMAARKLPIRHGG